MQQDHPDLVEIDRHLRSHLDRVLRAEQEAADLSRRRSATLRDRLIDLEDRGDSIIVSLAEGEIAGVIENVGTDHFDVVSVSGPAVISIAAVRSVRPL